MPSMEACAPRFFASSNSGKGGENGWTGIKVEVKEEEEEEEEDEEEEGSPAVKLGLGIGGNAPRKRVKEEGNGKLVFTPAQLHELQHQVIIYRYIEARLPVPFRLLLPIWKPVPCYSSASLNFPILRFSHRGLDHRTMLDPELGRCRRTDGKKWRCRKDVVPNQKYCERHMHRGSQRSRKPVEVSKTTPPNLTPLTASATCSDNPKPLEDSPSLQHIRPSPSISMTSYKSAAPNIAACNRNSISTLTPGIATHVANSSLFITNYMSTASNVGACNRNSISTTTSSSSAAHVATTSTCVGNNVLSYGNKGNFVIDKKNEESPFSSIINRSIKNENTFISIGISPGLGFSPKSVLQGSSSTCMERNEEELNPGRCRRTDGKRWRCKRDVVTNQKYCSQHMHRGAKKTATFSPPSDLLYAGIASKRLTTKLGTRKAADGSNLGKNLSIAVPSPQLDKEEDNSRSSCSSDATISDTIFPD